MKTRTALLASVAGSLLALAFVLALASRAGVAYAAPGLRPQAPKDGVWNLRRAGLQKVKDGLTSLEEVNNVTIE